MGADAPTRIMRHHPAIRADVAAVGPPVHAGPRRPPYRSGSSQGTSTRLTAITTAVKGTPTRTKSPKA